MFEEKVEELPCKSFCEWPFSLFLWQNIVNTHNKNPQSKRMEYKKLIIQQMSYDGTYYTTVGNAIDTQEEFNVVCEDFPFDYLPDVKDLAKREWADENGEDVYVPQDGLKFKAYDVDVTFLYVGTQENMQTDISSFISFITGRNSGGSPILAIYDEFTLIGRRGVIVSKIDNTLFTYDDINEQVIARFKVKFRVTDPTTNIGPLTPDSSN